MSQYLDAAKPMKGIGKPEKICLAAMVVVIFVYLFWYGAVEGLKKRNTVLRLDQKSYVSYAKRIYARIHEGKEYYGDAARMPIYPFLQSLLYDPALTDHEYFVRGQYFNIILTIILLVGIFFILKKHFSWLSTVTVTLLAAFTVFIFNAASFHAQYLFYFFNFCVFLLMCRMLTSPSWRLGILTGVMLGVAHLTKAAVMLGLGFFVVCALAKITYQFYRERTADTPSPATESSGRAFVHRVLSIVLVVACFLAVVYPYISMSKRRFGKYFYNVSTTFYMWYDSWEEAEQGTKAHGDRKGWPDMPPDQIPSFGKYLREHTARQILDRMLNGFVILHQRSFKSYGYYKYVMIYLAFLLVVVVLDFRHNLKLVIQHPFMLFFCLSYFVVYISGYAWYTPIASGNRFVLAQFLPLMFCFLYVACAQPPNHVRIRSLGVEINLLDALNVLVLLIFSFDIYFILTEKVLTMGIKV